MKPGAATAAVASLAIVVAGAYLRDPPWLIDVISGFTSRRADSRGRPYRWTGGRASFFVPATARVVRIPLRTPRTDEGPVAVQVDLNDLPTMLTSVRGGAWTECRVTVPPDAARGRRVVRVDLRVSPTWGPFGRGVQVGDVVVETFGSVPR